MWGKKHDLIGIVLSDPRERELPKAGLIKFKDAETGGIRFLDTSNKTVRSKFNEDLERRNKVRKSLFISSRLDSIEINTGGSYIRPLVDFFKLREKRW